MRDPYTVLGVSRSVSEKDLKSAYRKLAKAYHPDQNKVDPKAQQKFAEVSSAYDFLSDKDKKAAFDHFRRVVETQMLGYFEHEMAREYLRLQGAPTAPQISPKPPATKPRTSPPPGSI